MNEVYVQEVRRDLTRLALKPELRSVCDTFPAAATAAGSAAIKRSITGSRQTLVKVLLLHNRYRQAGGEDAVVNAEAKLLRHANTSHWTPMPRRIALWELKETGELPRRVQGRSSQYLDNLVEQDHRRVKQRIRLM